MGDKTKFIGRFFGRLFIHIVFPVVFSLVFAIALALLIPYSKFSSLSMSFFEIFATLSVSSMLVSLLVLTITNSLKYK